MAENFEVRLRESTAQELDGRQSENEVANRAAADDENPLQYRMKAHARIAAP